MVAECVPRRVQYSRLFSIRIRLKIYAPILIRYETHIRAVSTCCCCCGGCQDFSSCDYFRYLYFSWEKNYIVSPNDELHLHVSALWLKHKCLFFFASAVFFFDSIRLTNNNKTFLHSSVHRCSSGRNGSTNFVLSFGCTTFNLHRKKLHSVHLWILFDRFFDINTCFKFINMCIFSLGISQIAYANSVKHLIECDGMRKHGADIKQPKRN